MSVPPSASNHIFDNIDRIDDEEKEDKLNHDLEDPVGKQIARFYCATYDHIILQLTNKTRSRISFRIGIVTKTIPYSVWR